MLSFRANTRLYDTVAQPMRLTVRRPYFVPCQHSDDSEEKLPYLSDVQQKPLSPLTEKVQLLGQLRHAERSRGVARDELSVDTFSSGTRL